MTHTFSATCRAEDDDLVLLESVSAPGEFPFVGYIAELPYPEFVIRWRADGTAESNQHQFSLRLDTIRLHEST